MSVLLDIDDEREIARQVAEEMRRLGWLFVDRGLASRRHLSITVGVIKEAVAGKVPEQGGTYLELASARIGDEIEDDLDFRALAVGKAQDSAFMGGWPSFVGVHDESRRRPGSPKLNGSYRVPGNPRITSCSGFWGEHDLAVSAHGHHVWMELVERLSKASSQAERDAILAGR